MNTYRVWMRDGYASLHNAENVADAKRSAREEAVRQIKETDMTPSEKLRATTVRKVDTLSATSGGAGAEG